MYLVSFGLHVDLCTGTVNRGLHTIMAAPVRALMSLELDKHVAFKMGAFIPSQVPGLSQLMC